MDGCPLGLGLVVEDKPTEFSCERQVGAQRHTMDGDTIQDRLGLLEPVTENWHCLVCFLSVSLHAITLYILVHVCFM